MFKKLYGMFNVKVINSSSAIRTSVHLNSKQLKERMSELRTNDSDFNKFVGICEESIQRYIAKINTEKQTISNLGKCSKDIYAYIILPAEPVSPEQLDFLLAYLWNKYGDQLCGNNFKIREVYMNVNPEKTIDFDIAFRIKHCIKSGLEVNEESIKKKYILESTYDPYRCYM